MDHKYLSIILIIVALILMILSQVLFKSRLTIHGVIPLQPAELFWFVIKLLKDWQVWVVAICILASGILWWAAVSRVPLSFAFPFAAMSYPMIFICSIAFLGESFSVSKLLANALIVAGVIIMGMSSTAN